MPAKRAGRTKVQVGQRSVDLRQNEDPFNIVHRALLRKGRASKTSHEELPWDAFSTQRFDKKERADKERKRLTTKIHPVLKKWIAARAAGETEQLLINFR